MTGPPTPDDPHPLPAPPADPGPTPRTGARNRPDPGPPGPTRTRSTGDATAPVRGIADLLRRVVGRLREGYGSLHGRARRRFWTGLALGFAVSTVAMLLLVWAGRAAAARGLLAGEGGVLRRLATESPVSFTFAIWMDAAGNTLLLWCLILAVAGGLALARRPLPALALLVGHTANFPLVGGAWILWQRDRPELVAGGVATPGGPFSAYPSGHVQQAVFVYGLLCWLWARSADTSLDRTLASLVFLAATATVATARLRLGSHWPSDVVAGALLGGVWAAAVAGAVVWADDARAAAG